VDLARQTEEWKQFWDTVFDSLEVERQLKRLRWLEDFAFRCGAEIDSQRYQALQKQIDAGKRKLKDLLGPELRPETNPHPPVEAQPLRVP